MPKQINTPQVGSALVRFFNLKGRFQPVLDEVIVPVAIAADLTAAGGAATAVRHAGGFAQFEWTGGLTKKAWHSIENPATSGVDIHLIGLAIAVSSGGGAAFMTAPQDARDLFRQWAYLSDLITVGAPGTGTVTKGSGWHDTRLDDAGVPGPWAVLNADHNNEAVAAGLRVGAFMATEAIRPMLVGVGPDVIAFSGESSTPIAVQSVVISPGKGLYLQSSGALTPTAGSFCFISAEWNEVPLAGG